MNVQYAVYRTSDGEILRSGSCAQSVFSKQAGPGESVMTTVGVVSSETHVVRAGCLEPRKPVPVTISYAQSRRAEYPPLSDFADAMYWQSRGDDTKMADYLARCEAVKAKYPKPGVE